MTRRTLPLATDHRLTADDLIQLWHTLDDEYAVTAPPRGARRRTPPFLVVAYVATAAIMASILVATLWVINALGQV